MSIGGNFGVVFIGRLVFGLTQWLWIVLIAKFGAADDLGAYSLALSICLTTFALVCMNTRILLAADHTGKHILGTFIGLRMLCISASVICLLPFVMHMDIGGVLGATILLTVFDQASDILYGVFQRHERMRPMAISEIVKSVARLAIGGVTLAKTGSLIDALIARAAVNAVVLLIYEWPAVFALEGKNLRPIFVWRQMKPLILKALPLIIVIVGPTVATSVPQYILAAYWDLREIGVMGILLSLVAALRIPSGALGNILVPRFAKLWHANGITLHRAIKTTIAVGMLGGATGAVATYFFGWIFLDLCFGLIIANRAILLNWAVACAVAGWVREVYACALLGADMLQTLANISIVTALAGCALAFVLVPAWGAGGAMAGVTLASVLECVALALVWRQTSKRSYA